MPLEDRKSILQPETVEAQQFRLRESRLLNAATTPIAFENQAGSVTTARPSLLAPNPADTVASSDVVTAETSTRTDNSSNGSSTVPIVLVDKAADFDGSFFLTASNADLGLGTPSGSYSYGVMFKPDTFKAGHTQTIFRTYTGSFASHSIELSLASGGDLHLKYSHAGSYIRYRVQEKNYRQYTGKSGNGYTFVEFHKTTSQTNHGQRPLVGSRHLLKINGGNMSALPKSSGNALSVNTSSFDISNNDHFHIGGTSAEDNANFSGSIAFLYFGNNLVTADHLSLRDGLKDVSETSSTFRARAYKFNQIGAVEHTGSLATTQVPLGLSGSYAFVDAHK